MFDTQTNAMLEVASGFLAPLATIFYAIAIIKRLAKPQIATWLIWIIVVAITAGAMNTQGTINWQIIGVLASDVVIFGLALWRGGTSHWGKTDTWCLLLAGVALVSWRLASSADLALVFALSATVVGAIPTIVNAYKNPRHEPFAPWGIMVVSSLLLLASLSKWGFSSAAQPVVYLLTPVLISILSLRRYSVAQ